jgi:hypothetical protein
VSYPIAFDADSLRSKASLYFERAFSFDSDDYLFAFWCHLAIEHLSRAAIASVSPVLLASGRRAHMLHYALGLVEVDDDEIESITSGTVIELCERFIEGFGPAERATCEQARRRRNAELHSTSAAMNDLPPGWLGRFFAACRVLVEQLGLELNDLLPHENVQLVEQLIVEDAQEVRETVRNAIDTAHILAGELSSTERGRREEAAARALLPESDPLGARPSSGFRQTTHLRLLRELPCPGCKTAVALFGEVISHNPVRMDSNGQLVKTQIAIPSLLRCPVCELRLEGVAALTNAGVADPVTLTDYPDPVEALNIDINDYQDQFLQSLAEDYAYEDE